MWSSADCRVDRGSDSPALGWQVEVRNPVILTDNEMELDFPLADDGDGITSLTYESQNAHAQNDSEPPPSHIPPSPMPSCRHSPISSVSSSPPPSKRRRTSPSTLAQGKMLQQASKDDYAKERDHPSVKTLSESSHEDYLGEFIVEAWATTSDTKTTTHIHAGHRIVISRNESESSIRPDQGKGTQMKLAFEPKSKTKRKSKENNIVRFVNSKGSGEHRND
jgi:hypothetical protein